MAIYSALRVGRERRSFHTRVFAKRADFIISFLPSMLAGLIASILLIGLGIVLSVQILILAAAASILLLLSGKFHLQSPTYIFGLVSISYLVIPMSLFPEWSFFQLPEEILFPSILVLMSVLLFMQSFLIRMNGQALTSPQLKHGKRGRYIGVHQVKRLWILPIILFIPEGVIPTFTYWPVFNVGELSLQPIVIPFLLGFGKVTRALPKQAIQNEAHTQLGLAILASLFAIGLFIHPVIWLFLVSTLILLLLQTVHHVRAWMHERNQPAFFTEEQKSCRVVGVLPGSPAEKMNIAIGEEIVKVNGLEVFDEQSLYQALQVNPVYCKLEVKDTNGEKRFARGPLYSGEHYQLGVLLVRKEARLSDSIL